MLVTKMQCWYEHHFYVRATLFKHSLLLIFALSVMYSAASPADWIVKPNIQNEAVGTTSVAHNTNDAGYTLEVYKDADQVIKVRFSLYDGLAKLHSGLCPTYQIDRGTPANTSFNNAPCLATAQWAEYVFGVIQDRQITSTAMFGIMNGNNITFRFRLENGGYQETQISLAGSKRSLTNVVGESITVLAR